MQITRDVVIKDFEKLKRLSSKYFMHGNLNKSFECISLAATLMYEANLVYSDDDLENLLISISAQISGCMKNNNFGSKRNRIIFYDYFVCDNRGLTEQFIDAFTINNDWEILFVSTHERNDLGTEIYKKLKKSEIKTVELKSNSELEKITELYEIIEHFAPETVIAHTAPWDITGIVVMNMIAGKCKRFLSNITDHAFWLGSKSFDYYFEFRNYGYNISAKYRKIPKEKLLKLPYYPIVNTSINFQGFPFDAKDKKIIFSGGSIYKIQGSPKYFEIVKHILDNHDDVIFYFLGNGDLSYLNDFVKKNCYEDRFFFDKERKDIYQVFKRSDIYLNTYPLIGGLMTLFACVSGILPMTLNDAEDKCNDIYELFWKTPDVKIQFKNVEEICKAFDVLINDNSKLNEKSVKLEECIINKEQYAELLHDYISGHDRKLKFSEYEIGIFNFSETYIKRFNENNCQKYFSIFIRKRIFILMHFIKYFLCFMVNRSLKKIGAI